MAKIIEEEKSKSVELKRTKAELAFQKMQEKMVRLIFNFTIKLSRFDVWF